MFWPSGLEMSSVIDFLPRLHGEIVGRSRVSSPSQSLNQGGPQPRVSSPVPGRSTLITSAPRSARFCDAQGPARIRDRSSTRICESGRGMDTRLDAVVNSKMPCRPSTATRCVQTQDRCRAGSARAESSLAKLAAPSRSILRMSSLIRDQSLIVATPLLSTTTSRSSARERNKMLLPRRHISVRMVSRPDTPARRNAPTGRSAFPARNCRKS